MESNIGSSYVNLTMPEITVVIIALHCTVLNCIALSSLVVKVVVMVCGVCLGEKKTSLTLG